MNGIRGGRKNDEMYNPYLNDMYPKFWTHIYELG